MAPAILVISFYHDPIIATTSIPSPGQFFPIQGNTYDIIYIFFIGNLFVYSSLKDYPYVGSVIVNFTQSNVRYMKTLCALCTFLLLSIHQTIAQTYTFDWSTSFESGWVTGQLSNTANNINGSSVNATVSMTSNQGNSAFTDFTTFATPVVSGSPITTQLGANVPNIVIGCNFTNEANYADIVITFNTAVKNVTFNIADIDKIWGASNYYDEVVVTGTNSGTAVTNPTLTKLVSSNYFSISGNVATANTNQFLGGNSVSSTTDQRGTAVVDFGSTILTAVTIRYRNASASQTDPNDQSIGIGNISFQRAVALPLTLTSFNGALNNNSVQLNWSSAQEENLQKYIVEKSTDAITWQTMTTVKAAGNSNSTKEYNVTDPNAAPVNYYRLKQVDLNGNYTYSQIIRIRTDVKERSGIKVYPNPAINNASVTINSENKLAAHITLYNQFGMQLNHLQRQLIAGSNNIPIPDLKALPAGSYIIVVEDDKFNKIGTTQFIKQ